MSKDKLITPENNATYDLVDLVAIHGIDFNSNIIYVCGEIQTDLATTLYVKFNVLQAFWEVKQLDTPKEINIYLESYGGDADAIAGVQDFYEYLKAKGILVNVLVHGKCMSAATLILASTTGKRIATKRTRFMVHEIQISGGGGTYTQTKSSQNELDRLQEEYHLLYAEFSTRGKKLSKNEMTKLIGVWQHRCSKETFFSAQEAKEWGLIDEIK
jgi:ATP-dependent protease ClpP protease subunit